MYKLILSWRYLRTRYIALASIISVTLGVATMIVVNSVMAGFSHEMHQRLHGILSDLVVESMGLDGIYDHEILQAEVREILGDELKGLTTVVHIPAMLSYKVRGEYVPHQISLIGVDAKTHAEVSDFSRFLLHPENRQKLSFALHENGYDTHDVESGREVARRPQLKDAGWVYRRHRAVHERHQKQSQQTRQSENKNPISFDNTAQHEGSADTTASIPENPYLAASTTEESFFDPLKEQHAGVILGISIASVRHRSTQGQVEDYFLCLPGDDVNISFPTAGTPPDFGTGQFTVVDFYESKMNEYDSTFAFVPLHQLQKLRGMIDPATGSAAVTSIQIKLHEGASLQAACERLRERFPAREFPYRIRTWQEMQGPLLSAVRMETVILNILLFMIIAVAGFGILATFFMIVVEKTRDIGILKSLGASGRGVMSIFLSYGLSLGAVGSGAGMILGLLFVHFINQIATGLEWLSGREVFDPTVYYFQEIPTIINPWTVGWIVIGAVAIAMTASVMPALRAAKLHPVEALRYE